MKVLWLSANSGLLTAKTGSGNYNGGGWISSLQGLLKSRDEISLGLAFIGNETNDLKEIHNGVSYYSIAKPPQGKITKIWYYYNGYKSDNSNKYIASLLKIIEDFNPDIIHLFGIENQLSCILGNTNIPIVVHLQGILNPCVNAFWPVGFSKIDFLFPFSIREWILRNGFLYAKKSLFVRSKKEQKSLSKVQYFMGRTHWDNALSNLYAPNSIYYHVDEVLRDVFYKFAGQWRIKSNETFIIVSTISETVYKGLDFILKTCALLTEQTDIKFKWCVAGLSSRSRMVPIFEHALKIKSDEVHIQYMGTMKAEDLCDLELKSNLFVHPSYIDNSPNSLCEAQMLGLPVIATYVGGIPSLVESNKTGKLIPSNDPFLLAAEIKDLFYNPSFASFLGQCAYEQASIRHSKTRILESLINVYSSIQSLP